MKIRRAAELLAKGRMVEGVGMILEQAFSIFWPVLLSSFSSYESFYLRSSGVVMSGHCSLKGQVLESRPEQWAMKEAGRGKTGKA